MYNDWVNRFIRADFNLILSDSGYLWFTHGDVICHFSTALNLIHSPGDYDLIPANTTISKNGMRLARRQRRPPAGCNHSCEATTMTNHANHCIRMLREHEVRVVSPPLNPNKYNAFFVNEHDEAITGRFILQIIKAPQDFHLTAENHDWLALNKARLIAELTAHRLQN